MRRPQFGGHRKIEAGRHHAGDQEILVVQADVLADDGGVGGEAAAPQAVAQHRFALAAGLVFALLKAPAQHRLDTECGEEIGAHQGLYGPLRFAAYADNVRHAALPCGKALKRRALAANVLQIGRDAAVPIVRVARIAL
jgi:hypothetical protein